MESAGGARLCAPESKLNTSRAYVLASDTEHHIHVFKKKALFAEKRAKTFPGWKITDQTKGRVGEGWRIYKT